MKKNKFCPTMNLTLGGPARLVAKCLGAHFFADGHPWDAVRGTGTYGLRDLQYGGDNLQVPIFEGKLKYPQLDG
jgi:hypothetical protein